MNQLLVTSEEMLPGAEPGEVAAFAACSTVIPGTVLLIEASPTSASALAWALERTLKGVAHEAESIGTDVFDLALRRVAALPRQGDGPVFVPFLDGSRDNPAARGGWLDISSWNDEDALLGAVVEGVCMEHRRHIERLSPTSAGLPLRLSGGAAKSATWAQRFADVTARDVEVSGYRELGAVGAAIGRGGRRRPAQGLRVGSRLSGAGMGHLHAGRRRGRSLRAAVQALRCHGGLDGADAGGARRNNTHARSQ